jgi:hypothetical protein
MDTATKHSSKFEQSKMDSTQEATARTLNPLKASRGSRDQDIISNKHV